MKRIESGNSGRNVTLENYFPTDLLQGIAQKVTGLGV